MNTQRCDYSRSCGSLKTLAKELGNTVTRSTSLFKNLLLTFILASLLTFIVSPASLFAAKLQGRVYIGASSEKVLEANLFIPALNERTRTDDQGRFVLEIDKRGSYRIEVTHVSFEKQIVDVTLGSEDLDLTIRLLPRTYISDEIVVTGTRTPYLLKDVPVTTEVISTREAMASGATTVDQALKSAVGMQINNNFTDAGVSIRGVDPTRVLILVDGQKQVGRVNGVLDLAQMSLNNVEKIEVVKGAGSTLYGSDAIGGVVNIITRKPSSLLRVYNSSEYGSFNAYTQLLELEGKVGKWGLQLGSKFDRTDGFDLDKSTPQTNGVERINRFNLDPKASIKLSKSLDLSLNGNFLRENKKWLESEFINPYTYVYDDNENNYRYSGGSKLAYQPSPATRIEGNAYATYYDHLWEKLVANSRVDKSLTKEFLSEGSVVATHSYKEGHVITMGGDITTQQLKSTEVADGKQSVNSGDVYMQYEWKPLTNFTVLPGIRYEDHSTYGDHVNASINLMYNPHPRLRLRAFHGGGYRAPSIKEIYFLFDHSAAGYVVQGGGPGLKPERSQNSSFSVEYSYGGIGLHRMTFFYNNLDDLIEFDLLGFSPTYWRGIYRYKNVFQAYTKGIEWQSEIKVNHHMDLSLSYTWLIAKNLMTHNWLLNQPEHTVKLRYTLKLEKIGMTTTVWGSWYSGKLWVPEGAQNDFNSNIWAPTRRDLNVSLSKTLWKGIEAFGRVENITNDENVTYGYWPGRTFFAGIRLSTDKQDQQ